MMLSRRMAALRLAAPPPAVDAARSIEDALRETVSPPPLASAAPSLPRPALYESRGNDRRPHRR